MESDTDKYKKVFISFQISEEANKLLSESCARSGRKKIPEAALRLTDHLHRFRSISELNHTISFEQQGFEAHHDDSENSKKTK